MAIWVFRRRLWLSIVCTGVVALFIVSGVDEPRAVWHSPVFIVFDAALVIATGAALAYLPRVFTSQKQAAKAQVARYKQFPVTVKEVAMAYAPSRLGLADEDHLAGSKLDWRLAAESFGLSIDDGFDRLRAAWEKMPLGVALAGACDVLGQMKTALEPCSSCNGAGYLRGEMVRCDN